MKVALLLSSSSVTGPAELMLDDAKALVAAGHEVLLGCDTRRPGNFVQAIRAAGLPLMDELTLCPKPRAFEVPRDAVRLRARLADVDLVHARFSHDHSVAMLAMLGLRRRPALVRTAEIAKSLRTGSSRSYAFKACAAVVAPCESYRQLLIDRHGVKPERAFVLAGRVDSDRFSPGDGSRMRRELAVGEGDVLFGVVSRIKVERRHELLVRAFARLAQAHPEAKLAIVGRGEYEPDLRRLVAELGLEQRVLFAGYRTGDALVEAYRALDVKVWLAEGNDGTCRAVLEAMACGKPVVVGNEGAMAEVVRDHTDGFVCSLAEEPLAAALAELCDRDRRRRMGGAARARAVDYSPERRAAELVKIYEAAVAGR